MLALLALLAPRPDLIVNASRYETTVSTCASNTLMLADAAPSTSLVRIRYVPPKGIVNDLANGAHSIMLAYGASSAVYRG